LSNKFNIIKVIKLVVENKNRSNGEHLINLERKLPIGTLNGAQTTTCRVLGVAPAVGNCGSRLTGWGSNDLGSVGRVWGLKV